MPAPASKMGGHSSSDGFRSITRSGSGDFDDYFSGSLRLEPQIFVIVVDYSYRGNWPAPCGYLSELLVHSGKRRVVKVAAFFAQTVGGLRLSLFLNIFFENHPLLFIINPDLSAVHAERQETL